MTSTQPLLIVGSMAFDDLILPSGEFENVVGGAATYAAIAATLFTPARLVAVVGKDFPDAALSDLERRGVDLAGVAHASGKTFRWRGRYAANLASRETLDTQLNVFADFEPTLPPAYRSSEFVLLGNIHPELQLRVLSQVERPRLVAADTMNFWIQQERSKLLDVLRAIQLLVVNDEELRLLAGDHNIKRSARAVLGMGPNRLIVKRGDAGALMFDSEGVFFAPALPLHAEVDPTGAGDTFAGATLGHLAGLGVTDTHALRRSILVGSTVASFCVEGVGCRALECVTREHVRTRLDELRAMIHVADWA
jgi:sugar/nucleoside kinase (ribokinase family)